ncbi:hypothetical protein OOT46_18505 [Aquabacterium sp. A7-Y]|uniref:hypothetical protein n=1 Tax=Aquabacterium sp. A7-Y TaxID=1349605 RepID=UPI00223D5A1C|nr:hypothetical protein [Aquabacterium sp. A7-Y]MCW7539830.1 hypothetical protein [Aquabacterium sp. A7-Y]
MPGSKLEDSKHRPGDADQAHALGHLRASTRQLFNPLDRASEVAGGLLVLVIFTGAFAILGRDARTVLLGALSSSFAWSLICAAMYLRRMWLARERQQRLLHALSRADSDEAFLNSLSRELPETWVRSLTPQELARLRAMLPRPPQASAGRLSQPLDLLGATAIFALVFWATFPVALPLLWLSHVPAALRITHGLVVLLLFCLGLVIGRRQGARPVALGLSLAGLGALLTGLCMALQP